MILDSIAKYVNKLRIFPRVLIVSSSVYLANYIYYVTDWYMLLGTRTPEDTGFAIGVITLLAGVYKFLYDKYTEGGTDHVE